MPAASTRNVAIVSPWYPNREVPFRGSFVRAMVEATAAGLDRMTVYHTDSWAAWMSRAEDAEVTGAYRALLPRALRPSKTVAGADLYYVPVPMPANSTFAQIAAAHGRWLGEALRGKPIDAPVVHAHCGMPSGWAALNNVREDARLFVTEHVSFLDKILAEPDGREMYGRVMRRCEALFAVGEGVRQTLSEAFPDLAHKISGMPNPISFEEPRPEPVTELRRWLYVGGLLELKGVGWLLEAFAKCHADDPTITLSMVGTGKLMRDLKRQAVKLGVEEAVTFHGAVPPDQALRLMREHDLLVHASRRETFGMVVVEAVAAGLPILVTRCGGPEQTLAGIERAVGEMIPVEENSESIVEGYRRLRSRFPHDVDLALAHRTLDSRYGYPAVARAHYSAWFPGEREQVPVAESVSPDQD